MLRFLFCALWLLCCHKLPAQQSSKDDKTTKTAVSADYGSRFDHWPLDYRIGGTVVAGKLNDAAELESVLGSSERRGTIAVLVDQGFGKETSSELASVFHGAERFTLLRRTSAQSFQAWAALAGSSDVLVWISASIPGAAELRSLQQQKPLLSAFVARGGTIVVGGPAGVTLGSHFANFSDDDASGSRSSGLGLIPETVMVMVDNDNIRATSELQSQLESLPRHVGVVLSGEQCLRLRGRQVTPLGEGSMTFTIASDREDAVASKTYRDPFRAEGVARPRSANDFVADLTQWRRRAYDLELEPFPTGERIVPQVANGALVIVGGGGMPRGLMDRFVEMAGGAEQAKLVYVPCTEQEQVPSNPSTLRQWRQMGVKDVRLLHTKDRTAANEDRDLHALLADATGVWFGGGRQWNFADSYYGTKTQTLMHDVLRRGGVIGGSSAGASIQADFLARATPIENTEIIAPGYLRGGLGFLKGVAIDQHFSQRRRQADLESLVRAYPQTLGIGIDEATAIIVEKSRASVVGRGDVYFYDSDQSTGETIPPIQLASGKVYDLALRREVEGDD